VTPLGGELSAAASTLVETDSLHEATGSYAEPNVVEAVLDGTAKVGQPVILIVLSEIFLVKAPVDAEPMAMTAASTCGRREQASPRPLTCSTRRESRNRHGRRRVMRRPRRQGVTRDHRGAMRKRDEQARCRTNHSPSGLLKGDPL